MGANFNIEIGGSSIGGLQVGYYVNESSDKNIFTIAPDTLILPTSYKKSNERGIFWNDTAIQYYEEGAVETMTNPTSYHRLIKLDDTHFLCATVDVGLGTAENPSEISSIDFYIEDTSNNTFYSSLQGQPLKSDSYYSDCNFLFISDAQDSSGYTYKHCVYWGAYTNVISEMGTNEEQIGETFFKNFSSDKGIFTRFVPNQYLTLEEYFFSGTQVTNNILSSVGNAGSALWDSESDIIDLP